MSQTLYEEGKSILPAYPLKVTDLQVFSGEGSRKALWRVSSSQGEYLLKRSHYPLEKILFSIYGQLYVLQKGGRVPPILKTIDGLPYVNDSGTVYMMYKWFPEARNPDFFQKEDLKKTLIALALFHRTCEGYKPPVNCEENWRLGKGTLAYEKMINHMIELRSSLKDMKAKNIALATTYISTAIDRSEQLLNRLKQIGLDEAIQEASRRRLLTHEDFGEPNALIVNHIGYVIDIDGLAYNLPSRDLARVLIKGIRKHGANDRSLQQMIAWYESENPFSKRDKEILLLEMAFPNQFLRILNNDLRSGNISTRNYSKVIQFEERKLALLNQV